MLTFVLYGFIFHSFLTLINLLNITMVMKKSFNCCSCSLVHGSGISDKPLVCVSDGEGDPGVTDPPAGAGEGERAL